MEKKNLRLKKTNKMYLHLGKTIKTKLTPQHGVDEVDRIDIHIAKADEASTETKKKMALTKDRSHRVRCRIHTDEKGDSHMILNVPTGKAKAVSQDVLMRTTHGKLFRFGNRLSAYFSFTQGDVDIPDMIEEEASDMADWVIENMEVVYDI